jgi:hypothetical protein
MQCRKCKSGTCRARSCLRRRLHQASSRRTSQFPLPHDANAPHQKKWWPDQLEQEQHSNRNTIRIQNASTAPAPPRDRSQHTIARKRARTKPTDSRDSERERRAKRARPSREPASSPPQRSLPITWACAACTFENAENQNQCEMCNSPRPAKWACPVCTMLNEPRYLMCTVCGWKKKTS